jgi:hypothetical protein
MTPIRTGTVIVSTGSEDASTLKNLADLATFRLGRRKQRRTRVACRKPDHLHRRLQASNSESGRHSRIRREEIELGRTRALVIASLV